MDSYEITNNIISKIKELPTDTDEQDVLVKTIIREFHHDNYRLALFVKSLINHMEDFELYDDSPIAISKRVQTVLPEDYELTTIKFRANNHTTVTLKADQWKDND